MLAFTGHKLSIVATDYPICELFKEIRCFRAVRYAKE